MSRHERYAKMVREYISNQRAAIKNQERRASIEKAQAEREKAEIQRNITDIRQIVFDHGTLTVPDNPKHLGISIKAPRAYAQVFPTTEKSFGLVYVYQSEGVENPDNPLENIVQQFWIFEHSGEAVHIVNTNFPGMHQFAETAGVEEQKHTHEGFFQYTGTIDTFSKPERETILQLTNMVLGEIQDVPVA